MPSAQVSAMLAPDVYYFIKYFHQGKYFGNEPTDELNKVLFTFAAYDCGPRRMEQLRAEAAQKGLDPNVWINNVEVIAAARCGFRSMWAGDSSGCGHRKRSDVGSDSVLMWAGKSD
jgi:hypothetical protein